MTNKVNGPTVICVKGTLTDEGVECQALRSDDGELYTLLGELNDFHNGDRVVVCGTTVEISFCMQGTTIVISWIGAEPIMFNRTATVVGPPKFFEGSPIIIGGGGSVSIFFDSATHYKPTGTPNEFAHPTDETHAGYLFNRFNVPQNLTPSMAQKDFTLTVACLDGTGLDSPIIIDSRPRGPLRIRFRESDYPFDVNKGVYYSPNRTLTSMQLRNNAGANPPQVLSTDPSGRIEIINSLP
jgi:hypothetical protein